MVRGRPRRQVTPVTLREATSYLYDDDELHLSCRKAAIPRTPILSDFAVAHGTRTWGGPGGVMCEI